MQSNFEILIWINIVFVSAESDCHDDAADCIQWASLGYCDTGLYIFFCIYKSSCHVMLSNKEEQEHI